MATVPDKSGNSPIGENVDPHIKTALELLREIAENTEPE
jgi:hypothetical protein